MLFLKYVENILIAVHFRSDPDPDPLFCCCKWSDLDPIRFRPRGSKTLELYKRCNFLVKVCRLWVIKRLLGKKQDRQIFIHENREGDASKRDDR